MFNLSTTFFFLYSSDLPEQLIGASENGPYTQYHNVILAIRLKWKVFCGQLNCSVNFPLFRLHALDYRVSWLALAVRSLNSP